MYGLQHKYPFPMDMEKCNMVWAFDLGKASIGEAVREGNNFKHKASLLIPAEFAETKTAASRRRMWRTRQAHKAREQWLQRVMCEAGIQPLIGRRTEMVNGKWQLAPETPEQRLNRERLEREFAAPGDDTCYTSCLLRIKLLRGEKLEPWQIFKALHSAIQKRGYGKVPWAAREQKRTGKTDEAMDKELGKKDPAYKAAVEAWPKFKQEFPDSRFHFPCYYDAWKMGLWSGVGTARPHKISEPSDHSSEGTSCPHSDGFKARIDCQAQSTRRVRFDRADVEKEIETLARNAAELLPQIKKAFESIKGSGWIQRNEKTKREKCFPVVAKDFGEFIVHGPAGKPPEDAKEDFGKFL